MSPTEIHQRLQDQHGDAITAFEADALDPFVLIKSDSIVEVCRFLHDDPDLAFDCLTNMSGVDFLKEDYIQVVLHLYSYTHRHVIVVKANVSREEPSMPSVEAVWKAANWLEREIYDLLGVVFTGHSDLRRLLMPEDWVGHPLRKDFVEPEEYHGISTRRESLLK